MSDAFEGATDAFERVSLAALNPLFYRVRSAVRFRRPGYRESPSDDVRPTPSIKAWLDGDRARALVARYRLEPLRPRLSPASFALTVLRLDLLDLLANRSPALVESARAAPLRLLDVGAKNFDSAIALERFFRERVAPPSLAGVEIDAYRVYRGFHSRIDVARYYLSLLPTTEPPHRYAPGDIFQHHESYDVVTWFKPFLTDGPLLRWGLPKRLLRPGPMLAHVVSLMAPGGRLLIVNQELHEADAQESLLHEHGGLRWTRVEVEEAAIKIDDAAHAFVVERSE